MAEGWHGGGSAAYVSCTEMQAAGHYVDEDPKPTRDGLAATRDIITVRMV